MKQKQSHEIHVTIKKNVSDLFLAAFLTTFFATLLQGCSGVQYGTHSADDTTIDEDKQNTPKQRYTPTSKTIQKYNTDPNSGGFIQTPLVKSNLKKLIKNCKTEGFKLKKDTRLSALAEEAYHFYNKYQKLPHRSGIDYLARRMGIVEPTPNLYFFGRSKDNPIQASDIKGMLERQQSTHIGLFLIEKEHSIEGIVALSMRHIKMSPVPKTVSKDTQIKLMGNVKGDYQGLELVLTMPNGETQNRDMGISKKFKIPIQFELAGAYKVELLANSKKNGITVVANFPVYVDTPFPNAMEIEHFDPNQSSGDPFKQLLKLVNKERKKRGLNKVETDKDLSKIAQAHSEDMHANNFVGHVSPTTGDFPNRTQKANIHAPILMENVGRGDSIPGVHRGLMESPGHRAAILEPRVTHIGLGIVQQKTTTQTGSIFIVTEVFSRKAEKINTRKAPKQLLELINQKRAQKGLASVKNHRGMSKIAKAQAKIYFSKKGTTSNQVLQGVNRAVKKKQYDFTRYTATMVLASSLDQMTDVDTFYDPQLDSIGLGMAQGKDEKTNQLVIALVATMAWK